VVDSVHIINCGIAVITVTEVVTVESGVKLSESLPLVVVKEMEK
jgi:hypothetical protein